jgi:hypothetical protein
MGTSFMRRIVTSEVYVFGLFMSNDDDPYWFV